MMPVHIPATFSGRRSRICLGKLEGSRGAVAKYSFHERGRDFDALETFVVSRFTIL